MTDLTNITLPDLSEEGNVLQISLSEGAAMLRIEADEVASCRVEIGDLSDALTLLANHDERAADRKRSEEAAEPERRRVREAELERVTLRAAQDRVEALIDSLEVIDAGGDLAEAEEGDQHEQSDSAEAQAIGPEGARASSQACDDGEEATAMEVEASGEQPQAEALLGA